MASPVTANCILMSIAYYGLQPRGENLQCIPSEKDVRSRDLVYLNFYHPKTPDERGCFPKKMDAGQERIHYQLHSLVFNEKTGIYPISMVRASGMVFDTDPAFLEELNRRVQNTVCIILSCNALLKGTCFKHVYGDMGQSYEDLITHCEIRHDRSITSNKIKHVLAPFHLVAMAQSIFGDAVIPVPDCKTEEFALGIINDSAPMLNTVAKEYKVSLIAPHYHKALTQLGSLLQEGFLIHVVRLPCAPGLCKMGKEKKFPVEVRSINTLLSLTKNSRFRIEKCYDRPDVNRFYVLCKKEHKQALTEIIKSQKAD